MANVRVALAILLFTAEICKARRLVQGFRVSSMEITYVRHGQSVGNAGVQGAIEKGSATAYIDGTLTKKGKQQVVDRVTLMDKAILSKILGPEVVLVSPLRRAMATSILLLGHAKHKQLNSTGDYHGHCTQLPTGHTWPRFEVVAEMREKIKSLSEAIGQGTDGDPMIYVNRTGRKVGEQLFCDVNAMDSILEDIVKTYKQEEERTRQWKVHHDGVLEPTDAVTFVNLIKAFKSKVLARRTETRVLMVGHSGWSRYAFGSFLPGDGKTADVTETLGHGARKVHALNNVGAASFLFLPLVGEFRGDPDSPFDPMGVMPGDDEFPNFEKKTRWALFYDLNEAAAAGLVPGDATEGALVMVDKVQNLGGRTKRIYMVSSSVWPKKRAFLTWFDEWGEPRSSACVSCHDYFSMSENSLKRQLTFKLIDNTAKKRKSIIKFGTSHLMKNFENSVKAHRKKILG